MDKKDQRNSVPLGTFRPSSAPPVPVQSANESANQPDASSNAAGASTRNDDTVQTRTVRGSDPNTPVDGESERKRVRTLLGVPTPPQDAFANGRYPSPPKWKKPSERDDEPTVREPAMAVPVARIDLKPVSARPLTPPTAAISDAIQQMLDEQTSVTMEVDDDAAIDLALQAETLQLPDSAPPPPAPDRGSSTPPVMLPAHLAVAHAREAEQVEAQIAHRSAAQQAPKDHGDLSLPELAGSSLAPAEVRRPSRRDDAAPALGFMVVAAMAVLGVGGWLATAGGYQRPIMATPVLVGSQAVAAAQSNPVVSAPPAAAASPVAAAPEAAPALVPAVAPVKAPVNPAPTLTPAVPAASKRLQPLAAVAARVVRTVRPTPSAVAPQAPPTATGNAARVVTVTKLGEPAAVTLAPATSDDGLTQHLPDAPDRDAVLARIESLRSVVSACAEGRSGVAELDITIAGTGSITTVLVGGDFAGTPQGSCIARSVRQAHFPKFKRDRFRLLYPFSL